MVRAEGGSLRFWGPGLLSTSPAFSMSSASHSAGYIGWLAPKTGAGPTFQWAGRVDAICRSRSNRAKRPRAGCILRSHICMSLLESTLLSSCNPQSKFDLPTLRQDSREEKNATEKKYIYDTRYDLNPDHRIIAPMLYPLSYGVSWQNLNINPYKLFKSSTYSAALFPSCGLLIDMFLLTAFYFYECPQLILFLEL